MSSGSDLNAVNIEMSEDVVVMKFRDVPYDISPSIVKPDEMVTV